MDLQSKVCYIYDYFHDDKPHLADNITHENTTKTRIDAKFIVTKYASIDKDQIEYHLQFKPSQKMRFNESDELFYFETDYRNRYRCDPFIGKYVDIPDDTGEYHKWMIVQKEIANQFVKFLILPCDYYLHWVENTGKERIKRKMWCVSRAMNSYTSGRYTDHIFTSLDDIQKVWLPLNKITENLSYLNGENNFQRIILSALVPKPLTWQISKCESTKPLGILKITLDQDSFNPHTDYVNFETGEMYADLYASNVSPSDPSDPLESSSTPFRTYGKISASTFTIKVGGSYKVLSAKIFDKSDLEITDNYSDAAFTWECFVDGENLTDSNKVVWLNGMQFNQKKLKFINDKNYLNKLLTVKCTVTKDDKQLEITEKFELLGV